MAQANDKQAMLRQNLLDAGCSRRLTAECMELAEAGLYAQMLQKLKKQRQGLLDAIHGAERELRCLDYLMHQVENDS